MNTLLTDSWNPISEEQRKAKEKAYQQARIIAWNIWFTSFQSGSISLENLLRNAQRSLIKLEVDDFNRWKTLGLLTEKALQIDPPKRSRGNKGQPESLRQIARELVAIANNEGFSLSRSSSTKTAFEQVSEVMADLGISVTPRQVEDWNY